MSADDAAERAGVPTLPFGSLILSSAEIAEIAAEAYRRGARDAFLGMMRLMGTEDLEFIAFCPRDWKCPKHRGRRFDPSNCEPCVLGRIERGEWPTDEAPKGGAV